MGYAEYGMNSVGEPSASRKNHPPSLLNDATNKMTLYAKKFIAHAATPTNIAQNNAQNISIKLDDIEAALKTVCQIIHTISPKLLFFSDTSFVPRYPFKKFAHIEKPWISKDNLPQLDKMWDCMDKTIGSWTHKSSKIEKVFYSS
jgi:hypothetical protein